MKSRWILLAAVALLPASASGQVRRTQIGQRLDANYQIGSGGYNYVVGGLGGVNSQLYVTGQVTGLGQFHGRSVFYAPNQLRLGLPSGGLGLFTSQSVGVPQAIAGGSHVTMPFYERSSTVFGVNRIVSGWTAPGTNAPVGSTPTAQSYPQKLYTEALADYRSIIPLVSDQAVTPVAGQPLGMLPEALVPMPRMRSQMPQPVRPRIDSLFGLLDQKDRERLARQLYEMDKETQTPEAVDRSIDAEVDARVDARIPAARAAEPPEAADRTHEKPPRIPGAAETPDDVRDRIDRTDLPGADNDAYLALLQRLRERRIAREDLPASATPGAPGARRGTTDVARDREIVIRSLAGVGPDLFNRKMAAAQKMMTEGKFYSAIEELQFAVMLDRGNPVARSGLSLAFFGAGEPYSAAVHLYDAMKLFPPMMETRLDVAGMMDVKTFGERLKQMDKRFAATDKPTDPLLLLLGAYMHANDDEKAKSYAKRLADAAGNDKILSAFATYTLTGKRPDEATGAQTRPSGE